MVIGIYTLTYILLLLVKSLQCSLVFDETSQAGLHIVDYCPKMEYCEEGAHVMCMFYDPKHIMGPECSNSQNITITPDLAVKLMDVTNAIRSRIALGKEKGKDGQPLPRGYGIFRLSWDEELATFAQVLANRCSLRRDLCRATKKFPNPGQVTGLVRFSYPDWLSVTGNSHFTTPGLTVPKLNYAITQTVKSWYNQKGHITEDMVMSYPDFELHPKTQARVYLAMVTGPATHMGCGFSAYSHYAHYDNNAKLIYNVVLVVCNFSAKPTTGTQVYTTTPPTQVGYTIKCGCPEGYDEDYDCLCVESRKPVEDVNPSTTYCEDESCKPAVVLLPIFTVEDAPPHKLLPQSFSNNTLRMRKSGDFKHDEEYKMNGEVLDPQSLNEFSRLLREPHVTDVRSPYEMDHSLIQPRFFNSPKLIESLNHTINSDLLQNKKHAAKPSIFSRATKFHLPIRKVFNNPVKTKEIKKAVAPRRNFANVQKLLINYLNRKHNRIGNILTGSNYEYVSTEQPKIKEIFDHVTANNVLSKNNVALPNIFAKFQVSDLNMTKDVKDFDKKYSNDEADKKLMILLDYLETEVKNIELDPRDKEIFDAKIRKIYNTVVGKPRDSIHTESHLGAIYKNLDKDFYENLITYENAADNEFKDETRLKDDVIRENIYENNKLKQRNQNSIRNDAQNYKAHAKSIYTFEDEIKEYANYRNRNKYNLKDVRNDKVDRKYNINEDIISYERRKYYQEKLDNLERKLQSGNIRRNVHPPRQVRPVLATRHKEAKIRPTKSNEMDTFYIPDRARFIHGF